MRPGTVRQNVPEDAVTCGSKSWGTRTRSRRLGCPAPVGGRGRSLLPPNLSTRLVVFPGSPEGWVERGIPWMLYELQTVMKGWVQG